MPKTFAQITNALQEEAIEDKYECPSCHIPTQITIWGFTLRQIRAILDEYIKPGVSLITEEEVRLYQLEAVKAFVEQVDIRFRVLGHNLNFSAAMQRELAELEKETNA
jgi:hypothetical protein